MKKIIFSLAIIIAISLVSCQEKTKEKVEDATEAIGSEMEQKMDTLAQKTSDAIDSTQAKTSEALKKGADRLDDAGENLKEESKK